MEGAGLEPGKANDGNSSTRWSSAFSDNQWWQVDLGSVQQVSQVRLNWESAYASHYKIQTSTDGTNFTDAADVNIASAGAQNTTFAARSARYVRVLGVTRATQWGYSFFDAEVYGPSQPPPGSDLALNKPASSLSVEAAGLEPGKANDGNSSTRWSSAFSDNQWWQVDLGSAQQIDTVKLNWESAFATHYLIQTSTDGTNFTQAADVTDSVPGPKTTTFTARSARYVRVLGLTRATRWASRSLTLRSSDRPADGGSPLLGRQFQPPTTLLPPMPIYEYRCENGHTFEVIQSMSDDPVEVCEVCGAAVEQGFHPVAVHFKGSGFYSTDYKSKSKTSVRGSDGDSSSGDGSRIRQARTRAPRSRARTAPTRRSRAPARATE